MSKTKSTTISMEDVAFIFDGNLEKFELITNSCFCMNCETPEERKIINYSISLTDIYDLILEGECATCGNTLKRYIETGDNPETATNAEATWKTNRALKELKIKKQK